MIKSLFFRFLLIIVIPILLLQFIGLYIFYERHWENISRRLEYNLVGEVKTIYSVINFRNFQEAYKIAQLLSFNIYEYDTEDLFTKIDNMNDKYLQSLSNQLSSIIFKPVNIQYSQDKADIIINILHSTKKVYALRFSNKKLYSPTVNIFFIWMIGSAILLIIISVLFMKNQVRAILQLAEVAEKLGKNQVILKFKPSGAKEVRIVGKAFLKMKARIERQIYYRTQLLAHISHDLRTPLTRMRLSVEFMENLELAQDFKSEIKFMENIIDEYLNFAKEEGNETSRQFNIITYLNKLIQSYNNPDISFIHQTNKCIVLLKPHALERAINNLIDNALKHYKNKIIIEFFSTSEYWYLCIDDDGKGIKPEYYKKVFLPFYKIDKTSKGFGLGLATVKSIIYSQGGKIKLTKSELNGLRVIVKVPL